MIESACIRLGYSKFKEEQLRSVVHAMSGRNAFVSFPTGYDESLCYAVLPLTFDELILHQKVHRFNCVVGVCLVCLNRRNTNFQHLGTLSAS